VGLIKQNEISEFNLLILNLKLKKKEKKKHIQKGFSFYDILLHII
jgi:hypothetical protein